MWAYGPHRATWPRQPTRVYRSWRGNGLGFGRQTVPGKVTRLVIAMRAGGSPRWSLSGHADGLPIPVLLPQLVACRSDMWAAVAIPCCLPYLGEVWLQWRTPTVPWQRGWRALLLGCGCRQAPLASTPCNRRHCNTPPGHWEAASPGGA